MFRADPVNTMFFLFLLFFRMYLKPVCFGAVQGKVEQSVVSVSMQEAVPLVEGEVVLRTPAP